MKLFYLRFLSIPIFSLLTFTLTGCSDDDSTGPGTVPQDNKPGVYIINEGNFNSRNSTLSYYIPDENTITNNVYTTSTGDPLGDTGHSLTIHDGLLYIVVNNSDKIEVLHTNNHSHAQTIQLAQGSSPRFIVFGKNNLGYISNLHANTVSVYDPSTSSIIKEIPVGNNPEELFYANGHIFAANSGFGKSATVSIINTSDNTVSGTLNVGKGPSSFARINAGEAAVLCSGDHGDFNDPNDDIFGTIHIINTSSRVVQDSILFGDHPEHLQIDSEGKLLTKTFSGIHRVDVSTKEITKNFISGSFYGLHFDAQRNLIYTTDAKDFQQAGDVKVYSAMGEHKNTAKASIIPSRMAVTE